MGFSQAAKNFGLVLAGSSLSEVNVGFLNYILGAIV